jgi:hypothetical protein
VKIVIRHRGVLGAFGYRGVKDMRVSARRSALRRASMSLGWLYIIRKLNALYVFNKYKNPRLALVFRTDREFASDAHASAKNKRPQRPPRQPAR